MWFGHFALIKKLISRLGFEKATQLLIVMAQFHSQNSFGKPETWAITCQIVIPIAEFFGSILRFRMSRIENILRTLCPS